VVDMTEQITNLIDLLDADEDAFLIDLLKQKLSLGKRTEDFKFTDRDYVVIKSNCINTMTNAFLKELEQNPKYIKASNILNNHTESRCEKCPYAKSITLLTEFNHHNGREEKYGITQKSLERVDKISCVDIDETFRYRIETFISEAADGWSYYSKDDINKNNTINAKLRYTNKVCTSCCKRQSSLKEFIEKTQNEKRDLCKSYLDSGQADEILKIKIMIRKINKKIKQIK
tara:strand:- start:478 stop:1167 length:690 start_codon:yes stop_codon:yes gene_type:complete